MAYRIAVASSDHIHIDTGFGEAKEFIIYEVEGTEYAEAETRKVPDHTEDEAVAGGCREGEGCGHGGSGGGCRGSRRVDMLSDTRCVICSAIGSGVQKMLSRKGISSFDIEGSIGETLEKIIAYISKIDNHISLIN